MTRKILFRGKSTRTGEWIEGDLTQDCDFVLSGEFGKEYHRYKTAIIDGGEIDEVHPHTVGQFTGLLDKNGVKVFEGDKIRIPDFTRGAFFSGAQPTMIITVGYCRMFNGFGFYGTQYDSETIVIGNIHEPEAQP